MTMNITVFLQRPVDIITCEALLCDASSKTLLVPKATGAVNPSQPVQERVREFVA